MAGQGRHWTFIVYPESAPNDWKDQLCAYGFEWAHSPLHDKDINPTGESKKAHFHVVISYGNSTTYNTIKEITDSLNQPIPQKVANVKGIVRYFVHMDNPDKYQYDLKEIKCFNGFDLDNALELSNTDKFKIKMAIIRFIKENTFTSYLDLILACENINEDWCKVLVSNPALFSEVIKDRWRQLTKSI